MMFNTGKMLLVCLAIVTSADDDSDTIWNFDELNKSKTCLTERPSYSTKLHTWMRRVYSNTEEKSPSREQAFQYLQLAGVRAPANMASAVRHSNATDAAERKRVLVIVDMQNDYCSDSHFEPSPRTVRSPWAMPLAPLACKIRAAMDMKRADGTPLWDLIAFTQDWLEFGTVCMDTDPPTFPDDAAARARVRTSTLVGGTRGTQVVSALTRGGLPDTDIMYFAKNVDDWATTTEGCGAVNGETGFFHELLSQKGFSNQGTTLFVTGIQTTRCVMKGAMHMTALGWDVVVPRDTTAGGAQEAWDLAPPATLIEASRAAKKAHRIDLLAQLLFGANWIA